MYIHTHTWEKQKYIERRVSKNDLQTWLGRFVVFDDFFCWCDCCRMNSSLTPNMGWSSSKIEVESAAWRCPKHFDVGESINRNDELEHLEIVGDFGLEHFDFLLLLKKPLSNSSSRGGVTFVACVGSILSERRKGVSGKTIVGDVWRLRKAESGMDQINY